MTTKNSLLINRIKILKKENQEIIQKRLFWRELEIERQDDLERVQEEWRIDKISKKLSNEFWEDLEIEKIQSLELPRLKQEGLEKLSEQIMSELKFLEKFAIQEDLHELQKI
ncbi:hypothetical protein [Carnobacterium mobile]|uniref:hypothetical protein n=1 Tax=Carnobacterium mobile TaxID=2750 RepID=UPI001866481F|nr:hypothetical protein [Carnobacterium mobile]